MWLPNVFLAGLTQFDVPHAKGPGTPAHGSRSGPQSPDRSHCGSLLLFDRTASGNVKPKGIIGGPKTMIIGGGATW